MPEVTFCMPHAVLARITQFVDPGRHSVDDCFSDEDQQVSKTHLFESLFETESHRHGSIYYHVHCFELLLTLISSKNFAY